MADLLSLAEAFPDPRLRRNAKPTRIAGPIDWGRAPVEAVFSALKQSDGRARTRCHSLVANTDDRIAFAPYHFRRTGGRLDPDRAEGALLDAPAPEPACPHTPPANPVTTAAPKRPARSFRRDIGWDVTKPVDRQARLRRRSACKDFDNETRPDHGHGISVLDCVGAPVRTKMRTPI